MDADEDFIRTYKKIAFVEGVGDSTLDIITACLKRSRFSYIDWILSNTMTVREQVKMIHHFLGKVKNVPALESQEAKDILDQVSDFLAIEGVVTHDEARLYTYVKAMHDYRGTDPRDRDVSDVIEDLGERVLYGEYEDAFYDITTLHAQKSFQDMAIEIIEYIEKNIWKAEATA